MKIYILLCLVAVSPIKATLAHAGGPVDIVITVLYYCDENGDKIVATGKVDNDIERRIKYYINTNIAQNLPVEIVPMYEEASQIPLAQELREEIQANHKYIFSAYVPTSKIREIAAESVRLTKSDYFTDFEEIANKANEVMKEKEEPYSSTVQPSIPNAVYFSIGASKKTVVQ